MRKFLRIQLLLSIFVISCSENDPKNPRALDSNTSDSRSFKSELPPFNIPYEPASSEQIVAIQNHLGIALPNAFVDLIRSHTPHRNVDSWLLKNEKMRIVVTTQHLFSSDGIVRDIFEVSDGRFVFVGITTLERIILVDLQPSNHSVYAFDMVDGWTADGNNIDYEKLELICGKLSDLLVENSRH